MEDADCLLYQTRAQDHIPATSAKTGNPTGANHLIVSGGRVAKWIQTIAGHVLIDRSVLISDF